MEYYSEFDNYHLKVIDLLKQELYNRHENIFSRLNFDNDTIFEEPLLYIYINQKDDKWLDSLIYGYEYEKRERINVFSNTQGIIYIPNIGYFITDHSHQMLTLENHDGEICLKLGTKNVHFEFEKLLYSEFGFEIVKYQHPLFELIFVEQGAVLSNIVFDEVYINHISSLNMACQIIKDCNPTLFVLLRRCLKKIMLFTAKKPNSFATMSAHNMIFLNVNPWDTEFFFVDHISHEGAHVIFFTLTLETKYKLFDCPFETLFRREDGSELKTSLYLAFHGLFTFSEITLSLSRSMDLRNISEANAQEIKGRFVFHMGRYRLMIGEFERLNICTSEGNKWFDFFKERYSSLVNKYNELLNVYNMDNQSYDFNYKTFSEKNSLTNKQGNPSF